MPRRTPEGRATDVARAACRVFIAKGFRRTLMADVSGALGLSQGALYLCVESKEALFHLALLYALGDDGLNQMALPHQADMADSVLLVERWAGAITFPILAAARRRRRVTDVAAELGAIIDERYAFLEGNRRPMALIERSAVDVPELSEIYYRQRRRAQVADLSEYLARRTASGQLPPLPDVPTAARFIVETIAWFAWHRRGDADSEMISDDMARRTVRHLLIAAFMGEAP